MKFSIVTPVYNGEKYLEEAIESVLSQEGDFEIEYLIQDGGSADKTLEIVKKYDTLLAEKKHPIRCKKISFSWRSEKDGGMYDAINKGFARATGDIFAWINSDDFYVPGAFATTAKVFEKYSEIEWLKGKTDFIEKNGEITVGQTLLYNQEWIRLGIYGRNAYFVHQDSVFWRSDLWKKAGGIKTGLRSAGDYYLWLQFAKYAPLRTMNKNVSRFRKRGGQLSEDMKKYREEQEMIAPHRFFLGKRVSLFFVLSRLFGIVPKSAAGRFFFFSLFPFHKKAWYIDFDAQGNPFKKESAVYFI